MGGDLQKFGFQPIGHGKLLIDRTPFPNFDLQEYEDGRKKHGIREAAGDIQPQFAGIDRAMVEVRIRQNQQYQAEEECEGDEKVLSARISLHYHQTTAKEGPFKRLFQRRPPETAVNSRSTDLQTKGKSNPEACHMHPADYRDTLIDGMREVERNKPAENALRWFAPNVRLSIRLVAFA